MNRVSCFKQNKLMKIRMNNYNSLFQLHCLFCRISYVIFSIILLFGGTLNSFSTGFQQPDEKVIQGKIYDENNLTIVGANVFIKGTNVGTITDADGAFTLKVSPNDTVVVSFMGYLQETFVVGAEYTYNLALAPDIFNLDELIVVGYGTVKKSDLTGAVGQVKGEELQKTASTDLNQALQGKIAGVRITNQSGAPGSAVNINIRGIGSVNGGTSPLYVIDGVPLMQGGIKDFDIASIESVEILKDASAGAIYGTRAANGVVLITTKRGKQGKTRFQYSGYYGIQQVVNKIDLLNTNQYRDFMLEYRGDSANLPPSIINPDSLPNNTDWQEEAFRLAPVQKHNLQMSGGNNDVNYMVDLGYYKQEDIYITGYYDRISLGTNIDFNKGRFSFGESLKMSYGTTTNTGGSLHGIISAPPYFAVYDESNPMGGWGKPKDEDNVDRNNPIAVKLVNDNKSNRYRLLSNTYFKFRLFDGLVITSNLSADLSSTNRFSFTEPHDIGYAKLALSEANQSGQFYKMWNADLLLNFDREFGNHMINSVIGLNRQYENITSSGYGFSNLPDGYTLPWTGETYNRPNGSLTEYSIQSFLGRLNYSFMGKYIATINIRNDYSSNFGKVYNNEWFPSLSLAWNVARESFLVNSNVVNELKIRGGYGALGFDDIGAYRYESVVNITQMYPFGNYLGSAHSQKNHATPDIRWESSYTKNIGLDMAFLENQLLINGDYFQRLTKNMLVQKPVPYSTGSSGAPYVNAGSVKVNGWELSLTYRNRLSNGFYYSINGHVSSAKNVVKNLGEGEPITVSNNVLGTDFQTKTEEGHEIGGFYGYVMQGIWQTGDTLGEYNMMDYSAQPGQVKYKDLNGDKKINDLDRLYIGSPTPDFIYGFTFDAEFKNWDASVFIEGVKGGHIYNIFSVWYKGMVRHTNQSTEILERYTDDNPSTEIPSAEVNSMNMLPSTRFLESASYLRFKNIQLGYTFRGERLANIGINQFRIYASAQNAFTISDFSGYDPEVGRKNTGAGSQLVRNVYDGNYPAPKIYSIGVKINF